jgi:HK97 family phage prohead protease
MTNIERRFVDVHTAITGNKLAGYAAVYSSVTDIGPYFEQLAPTAFRSALTSPDLDVVGLFNHDTDNLLARTSNGSLRLSTDSTGLAFEMDLLDDLALTRDIRAMVDAELLTGCSFAFVADEQAWTSHEGRDLRTHVSVARLLDVSVVTTPAYQATSVALRSKPTAKGTNARTQLIRAKTRAHRKVSL